MIHLGALSKNVLTSIRKDISRRISDVYFNDHGFAAPKCLCKFSSMSFLAHMCEIQAQWKEIPFSLFFDRFGIQFEWSSGNDNDSDAAFMAHWMQAIDTTTFRGRCNALYQYRMQIRQNLLACVRNLVSWNITAWWPSNIGYDRKLALVRRYVKKGPVCLQETKWTTGMACSMQQKVPGARIIDAPAIETDAGGVSGGVAVIVPSSFTVQETCIVVPGRVLGVRIQSRVSQLWIFSIYLHPVTKKDELDRFIQWLMSDRLPSLPCILAGDFNKADVAHSSEWSTLLSLVGLESTVHGSTTFTGPKGDSSLDDILIPTEYVMNCSMWPTMRLDRHFITSGHATLCLSLQHKPSVSSTPSLPSHDTIPNSAFQPGKDLEDYRRSGDDGPSVPKLIRRLWQVRTPTLRNLQTIHWQWWISEPKRKEPHVMSLKKHIQIHAKQPFVHVRKSLFSKLLALCQFIGMNVNLTRNNIIKSLCR